MYHHRISKQRVHLPDTERNAPKCSPIFHAQAFLLAGHTTFLLPGQTISVSSGAASAFEDWWNEWLSQRIKA